MIALAVGDDRGEWKGGGMPQLVVTQKMMLPVRVLQCNIRSVLAESDVLVFQVLSAAASFGH